MESTRKPLSKQIKDNLSDELTEKRDSIALFLFGSLKGWCILLTIIAFFAFWIWLGLGWGIAIAVIPWVIYLCINLAKEYFD